MPSSDSPEVIVARYLKSNNYNQTLKAFLAEAGLPPDAGVTRSGDWTIEKILEEKKVYDASLKEEKLPGAGEGNGWSVPAPSNSITIAPPSGTANVLCVTMVPFQGDAPEGFSKDVLFVSLADRTVHAILIKPDLSTQSISKLSASSPVLSIADIPAQGFATTEMSGKLNFWKDQQINGSASLQLTRQDHGKYAVRVTTFENEGLRYIATAGWDQKVYVYCQPTSVSGTLTPEADAPSLTLSFTSNPECLLFVIDPDTQLVYLVVSRRDSTNLYFYNIKPASDPQLQSPSASSTSPETASTSISLAASQTYTQNLAPHSNSWVSFTPSHFVPHPLDPTLLAISTNHVPHMKVMIVRLLFPSEVQFGATSSTPASGPTTQLAQSQAELQRQNREETAIIVNANTMAPQTPYSTPHCVWRPDGSGVWVNGDDGAIRGIETATGKVVAVLGPEGGPGAATGVVENGTATTPHVGGHEAGSKVRSLWAGYIEHGGSEGRKEEVVVSGGFDRKVILWKI